MSGRDEYVARDYGEMVVCKGRRAQGSKTATSTSRTKSTRKITAATPHGMIGCIAPSFAQNRDISEEIMSYLSDFYTNSDLRTEAGEILKGSIELKNNFVISVQTCSYRAFRGLNIPLSFCDELGIAG